MGRTTNGSRENSKWTPLESAAQRARLTLPHIVHPSERRDNPNGSLALQLGCSSRQLSQGRPMAAEGQYRGPAAAQGNGDPVPAQQRRDSSRRRKVFDKAALTQQVDALEENLSEYMRSGGFYNLKSTFMSFDPSGANTITKDSLMRVIANIVPDVTSEQFDALLKRVDLEKKNLINFEDFFQAFRPAQEAWVAANDTITNRPPKLLNASQAHSLLKSKVQKGALTVDDVTSNQPFGAANVIRTDFKSLLENFGVPVDKREFDKLWSRYDVHNVGVVPAHLLFKSWGLLAPGDVNLESVRSRTGTQDSSGVTQLTSRLTTAGDNQRTPSNIETVLLRMFNQGYMKMHAIMKNHDSDKSGFISKEDFRLSLSKFGIRLISPDIGLLLLRCGFDEHAVMIPYEAFLEKFMDRHDGGLVSTIVNDTGHQFRRFMESNSPGCSTRSGRNPNKPPAAPKPITTVDQAESRLLFMLQGEFLKILGGFQTFDRRRTGILSIDDFLSVLQRKLQISIQPQDLVLVLRRMSTITSTGLVNYNIFLQKLDIASKAQVRRAIRASVQKRRSGNDAGRVAEITRQIRTCLHSQLGLITDAFHEMDHLNTGKMTQAMLQGLLLTMGIKLSWPEVLRLWSTVLKTASNTLDFQEFIRHFCPSYPSYCYKVEGGPKKHMSDDHFMMRSKKLHRDEDIVMGRLKNMLQLSYYAVLREFGEHDPNDTGSVRPYTFEELIRRVCPQLSSMELDTISRQWEDQSGRVNYKGFLSQFRPRGDTYRVGNDMSSLLSQKESGIHTKPPPSITNKPTKGLPGDLARIRRKLRGVWKPLVDALASMDPHKTGMVTIQELHAVFNKVGVDMSRYELHEISRRFDRYDRGTINYSDLVNASMA